METNVKPTAHTATPWEVHLSRDPLRARDIITTHDAQIGIARMFGNIGQPTKANAEHIVRCVNSHEALVGASEWFGDCWNERRSAEETDEAYKSLKSAIKLAKGK